MRLLAASGAALLILIGAAGATAQEETRRARTEAFAKLPYWPGYWVSEQQAGTTIGGLPPEVLAARERGEPITVGFMKLNGRAAPWNEEGQRRQAARAQVVDRKAKGWGFPMMMNAATPIQVLITPEEVLIINSYNETRHIYTDGRPMPPLDDLWPTVAGTSIGHWEGDVLVIDTIQVKNPNLYFHGAPPLSEDAHYHERMWLDGDVLRSEITIKDPVTLAMPWKVDIAWVREEGFDRMVQIDWDNDRTGSDGAYNTIEPTTVTEDGE